MKCGVFCVIYLLFLISDVQSLRPIISPHDFFEGGSINVTCDHQTMDIDPSAKYIQTLTLSRKSINDASFNTLAIYSPFLPSGQTVTHFPEGKDWHVTFSGGNNQDSSNVQTIRINVMINNAECADAGLYSCTAFTDLSLLFQSPEQNETADAHQSQEPLVMIPDNKNGPYYSENVVGENVTLTCVAYGPEDLILTWKYRPLGSQKDRSYPNIRDVTLSQPQAQSSTGPCILWRLETSVSFTLQEYDNDNTYFCVVYDHTDEMSRENFTIGIASVEEAPQTQSSGGVNVGGVVGGVIAGVVVVYVVIMLVYCLWCKKRCKRDQESHGTSQDTESRENANGETKKSSKVKLSSIFSFLKSKMSQEKETGKGGQIQGYNVPKRVSMKDSTGSLASPTYPATISSESKRKDSLDTDLKQSPPDRSMPPPSQGVPNVYETRGARGQLNRGYTGDVNRGYTGCDVDRRENRPGVKPRADVDYDVIDDVNALEDGDRPQMYKREDRQRRRASRNTPAEAPSSTSDGLFI